MGKIKTMLSENKLKGDSLFSTYVRIESSECVHLHWRDCRIVLTPKQFTELVKTMNVAISKWNGHCDDSKDILLEMTEIPESCLFKNRLALEVQEGPEGIIHFHYDDLRIEMELYRFWDFVEAFEKAKQAARDYIEMMAPLTEINPFDHCHKPTKEEWLSASCSSLRDYEDHLSKIEEYKNKISNGYQINPIVITKAEGFYQRRDGYCRYMAYSQLGMSIIPCYLVSEELALTCPQHGKSAFRMAI